MADQNDPTDQDLNKRPPAPSVVDAVASSTGLGDSVHDPDTGADPGTLPGGVSDVPDPTYDLPLGDESGDAQEAPGDDTEITTGGEEAFPRASGD